MRFLKLICFVVALLIVTGCKFEKIHEGGRGNSPAEPAGPRFAILCISRSDWPRLLSTMKTFAAVHDLEMHGGIDYDIPHHPFLNVYLAQGYVYYFGDDFDMTFMGDPFRKDVVYVGGILSHKPITREQQAFADELLSKLSSFTRRASGPEADPACA